MKKILSAQQVREADAYTIAHEPIASIDLMERAAEALLDWILASFPAQQGFYIFCGLGNNGGDGLALARLLKQSDAKVEVFIANPKNKKGTADFELNLQRLKALGIEAQAIASLDTLEKIDWHEHYLCMDALLGTGLNRPMDGFYADLVSYLSDKNWCRIAIDTPSGLFADEKSTGPVFEAHITLTFQLPKLAFLMPSNLPYVGEWHSLDIGLHPEVLEKLKSPHYLYEPKTLPPSLRRKALAHKGDFGRALLISGSKGKCGAAQLSAKACLRSGVGLLYALVPDCGYTMMQSTVPEAMVIPTPYHEALAWDTNLVQHLPAQLDALGAGPGLGTQEGAAYLLEWLFKAYPKKAWVLDADALNCISLNKKLQDHMPEKAVLSPHPGEMARLVKAFYRKDISSGDSWELWNYAQRLAIDKNVICLLKGPFTAVCSPEGKTYFNRTGNAGLASGGSGDVLTGMILALLAQGLDPQEAASLAAWVHGKAAERLAPSTGLLSMLPSDLIQVLPVLWQEMEAGSSLA